MIEQKFSQVNVGTQLFFLWAFWIPQAILLFIIYFPKLWCGQKIHTYPALFIFLFFSSFSLWRWVANCHANTAKGRTTVADKKHSSFLFQKQKVVLVPLISFLKLLVGILYVCERNLNPIAFNRKEETILKKRKILKSCKIVIFRFDSMRNILRPCNVINEDRKEKKRREHGTFITFLFLFAW